MANRATHTLSCPVIVEYPPNSGRIVLVGEPKKGFSLNFPGGGVDLKKNNISETLEEAAIREAKEESGLDVELNGIIGLNQVTNERKIHFTLAAVAVGGILETSIPHPIVAAVTLEQIEELDSSGWLRSPRVLHWAREYFNPTAPYISLDNLIEFDSDPYPTNKDFSGLQLG